MFDTFFDTQIMLFRNHGNILSYDNFIAENDGLGYNLGLGLDDTNGSASELGSFMEIFLGAGDYTVAIGAFLSTVDDVDSGQGLGLVWDGGGNGFPTNGEYHINIYGDVAITSPPCHADLNGDNQLDFFDVSAFLTAFGTQDPIADFTGEGAFDFFDVSAFLAAFGVGCP